MLKIRSTTPDANIVFYPFVREDTSVFVDGSVPVNQRMDVTEVSAQQDILNLQISKPKSGVGTWNCTLSSRVNWKSILEPGCWCIIYLSNEGLSGKETSEIDSGIKMIGIVKSIRRIEDIDPSAGTRRVRFVVAGEDFHSVFNTPIYLNINLSEVIAGKDVAIANAKLVLQEAFGNPLSPADMVKALVDALLGRPGFSVDKSTTSTSPLAFFSRGGQPYLVPQALAKKILGFDKLVERETFFTRIVTFFLQTDLIGKIALQSDFGQMITPWSLIQSYAHTIVNEIFTDLLPVNINNTIRLSPALVLRAIPFSSQSGKETIGHSSLISMQDAQGPIVPTRRAGLASSSGKSFVPPGRSSHFYISRSIAEDEIFSINTGKADVERFNFFFVPPNLTGQNNQQKDEAAFLANILSGKGFDAIGDKHSIARYGLRPFFGYSDYMFAEKRSVGLINQVVKDIYEGAYLFESGQVVIAGTKEFIPVGTNIEFLERTWVAHVEKVDHAFEVRSDGTKSFRTTITFSRLQNKADGTPVDTVESGDRSAVLGPWDRGVSTT